MHSVLRAASILLAGSLAAAGDVAAQTSAATPLPQPPAAGWILTPALGVGGSWNDNVLLVNPDDEPPADYATPINPSLDITYLGRRTQFSSAYEGSILIYRSLEELNSFEQMLRASVEHHLSRRLTLFAKEEFTRAPTTDALLLAGVPFYHVGSTTNAAGGGLAAALTKHTTLRGAYTLRTVRFEFDERIGRELRGGHAHEFSLGLERAVNARLVLIGDYDFVRATVSAPAVAAAVPSLVIAPDENFNIQSGRFTAQFLASPTVTLTGGLGVSHLDAGLTLEAQTAPLWQVGVTQRLRHGMWSATYQRSMVPSYGFGGTFQNEELVGTVHVPFARNRAYADGSVSWFDADSIDPAEPSLRSTWISGKVGYYATRWLRVEGYYSRAQQNSQRAGGQLGRNHVGIQVVTSKPMRIR